MQRSSTKLYFATSLLTFALASFAFAGNGQCPLTDPPPPKDGDDTGLVIVNTNPSMGDSYQFLKRVWELLAQNTDLF